MCVSYFSENRSRDLTFLSNTILALSNLRKTKLSSLGLIWRILVALEHCNRWYRTQFLLRLISTHRNLIHMHNRLNYIIRRLWLNQNGWILVIRMLVVNFAYVWHLFHRVTMKRSPELLLRITHKLLHILIFQNSLRSVFFETRYPLVDCLLEVIFGNFIFFHRFFSFRMI